MNYWVPLTLAAAVLVLPASAARGRLGAVPHPAGMEPQPAGAERGPAHGASGIAGPGSAVAGIAGAGKPRPGRAQALRGRLSAMRREAAFACAAGAALALVIGGPAGLLAGAAAACAGTWWLRRRSLRTPPDDPLAVAAALDLMAACLRGGLPVADAVAAAAGSARGAPRTAGALGRVADLLALGGDTTGAWDALTGHPGLEEIARMARRSADSGASLAADAEDLAETFRRRAADDAVSAAEKAGVAIAGPLGVCFLPAFVCLGLAPVIVGLAGDILGSGPAG